MMLRSYLTSFIKSKLTQAFLLIFLVSCTHLFYYPSPKTFYNPKKMGFEFTEVFFKSTDGTNLSGWFFPAKTKDVKGTILQFHGNAENISTHFISLAWLTKEGYNLFTIDYRGYRKSEGSPSPEGLYQDAIAAITYTKENYIKEKQKFFIWGQSLGGIVALRAIPDILKKVKIDAVIIESSFSSYQRIAREKLSLSFITWLFQPLAYVLVSDEYSPEGLIKDISPIPIIVIHGTNDRVVPLHHGERIFNEALHPKTLLKIEKARHIQSMFVEKGKHRPAVVKILSEI